MFKFSLKILLILYKMYYFFHYSAIIFIMDILLTGSGGFVGQNLKKYLTQFYNILSPRSFELDVTNCYEVIDYFKKHNVDFIIHCGSVGGVRGKEDEENTLNANLKMIDNLILAKKKDTKIITFGSGAMYNKACDLHKVKENQIGESVPNDLYGKSKMLIAQKIQNRLDVLCLNIFACFGYNEKPSRFPSYAINQNLKNEDIVINQNVVFDYLFIEDLNKIVKHFIECNWTKNNIVNITPTNSISLLEIANIVNEISEFKSNIIIKNKVLNFEYTGDNSQLLKYIPEFEFTPYEIGISKLFNFIHAQRQFEFI